MDLQKDAKAVPNELEENQKLLKLKKVNGIALIFSTLTATVQNCPQIVHRSTFCLSHTSLRFRTSKLSMIS